MPILIQLAYDYLFESSVLLGNFLPQSSAERKKNKGGSSELPLRDMYILYARVWLPWWEREWGGGGGGVFTGRPGGMTCVDCCDADMFTEKQVFTRCVHATEPC